MSIALGCTPSSNCAPARNRNEEKRTIERNFTRQDADKKLSWKEVALSFRTSWDKVCQAVEVVVAWGLGHRLLWVGKERTVKTFEGFFDMIGADLSSKIEFVCSDMWKPYLRVIRERCSNALNILNRFHIVAKMNDALNDVRAADSRRLLQDGFEPVLT